MKHHRKQSRWTQPITSLTLEEQLARMTAQRNELVQLIKDNDQRYGRDSDKDGLYRDEQRLAVIAINELEVSLFAAIDELRAVKKRVLKRDSLSKVAVALLEKAHQIIGNVYCTEGYNFLEEDINPSGPEEG